MSSANAPAPTSSASGNGGGDGGNDNKVELIVAIVALVISVLAFIIAIFQALQQYYASATGYSSCTKKVIGEWWQFTHRRFKWSEFRFEVEFEAPVIFVAPPKNERGPLGPHKDRTITYMVGTAESYNQTYTWDQAEFDKEVVKSRSGNTRQAIHTADNELANWLGLLMAVQRMERESRTWQDGKYFGGSNQWTTQTPCHPSPNVLTPHTLTVGVQRKKKSWDSMPDNMKKPYATTTISHLVEMAAMLGIYWKEFNRNEDRYRAQGNGFMITGYDVDDLGVVFTFQKTGPTWFHENRLVPNNSVKELCFGLCPTIFRGLTNDNYKYADEPKDIGTLQLGSMSAIAETLVVIGCNTNTVKYFRKAGKAASDIRHSHLFPIAFEILGMVGSMLHVQGTAFRMLPNPTIWAWDRKSFSLRTFLSDFTDALSNAAADEPMFREEPNSPIADIHKETIKIEDKFIELEAEDEHEAILRRTTITEERIYSMDLINVLRNAIEKCDKFLNALQQPALVQNVLRVHLQEILRILNDKDGEYKVPIVDHADHSKHKRDTKHDLGIPGPSPVVKTKEEQEKTQKEISLLQQLDAASSGERHAVLVKIYLFSVRKRVVEVVCGQMEAERARRARRDRARSIASTVSADPAPHSHEQQISDVWCMLVFRMICWLLLHDFHGKDIQVEKSDIYGSRLPVYIT